MAGIDQYSPLFRNPALTNVMREVQPRTDFIGADYLPEVETYETDFNEAVMSRQQDMADFVDSNSDDYPLTDMDPLRTVSGSILDIAQSYVVTKKELKALQSKGSNTRERALMEKQLINKTAALVGNIRMRIEWMTWQALSKGQLVLNSGAARGLAANFRVPAGNFKVPDVPWNTSGSTVLDNLISWNQAYLDLNGVRPDDYVVSTALSRLIANAPDVREAIRGKDGGGGYVTETQVNDLLIGLRLAPLRVYDATYTVRDVNNNGTRNSGRMLPENVGVFLRRGGEIGDMLIGPTEEGGMEPGIFTRTLVMEKPRRNIIDAVGAAFPKIVEPNMIMVTTVQ